MATQTVYFNNPSDITTLQSETTTLNSTVTSMSGSVSSLKTSTTTLNSTTTSMSGSVASLTYANAWSRGSFVSSDLIYTIPANCWTGALPSLVGPAQPVSVYKVVYYSSDSTTSSVQRVSASVFVPQVIAKTGSMVLNIKGLQPGNNTAAVSWETYSNPTLQAGLALAAANIIPKFNPASPVDATYGVIFPSTYAIEAGLGYITVDCDGFGAGVSQNDCVYNYMSQINPQVDLLRCLRNMYTSGISTQKALFGNAVYNGSLFPVSVSGYSLGGIIAPGVVNEFSAGVSAIIPATEASAFTFKRILCGGTPDGQNIVSLLSNTNIGNFTMNPVSLFLFSNIGGNQPTNSLFADPQALSTYWPFWSDVDQKANLVQDITAVATLLAYSTAIYPPVALGGAGQYNIAGFGPTATYGFTGADIRQLYRPEYTGSLGRVLKNLHGWSNPLRPLYTLPDCSVAHIYSSLDEVVCPYGYTGSAPVLYGVPVAQQAGYNFDCASALDKYMTVGDVDGVYGLYNFTGAGKSKSVSEIFVNVSSGASAIPDTIVSAVTQTYVTTLTTSDAYKRIPIDFNTIYPYDPVNIDAIANHSGFYLYYQTVINGTLNLFTNAN
jgi:hypothetical protein